jgi:hypothetical protein
MKLQTIESVLDLQKQILSLSKSNNTKLTLAYSNHNLKNITLLKKEKFFKPLEEKKLELASVDSSNSLIFDNDGNFKFTKQAFKELQDYQDFLKDQEVEFEFYKTNFNSLSDKEKSIFYIKTEDKEFFINIITEETYKLLSYIITDLPELKYDEATI